MNTVVEKNVNEMYNAKCVVCGDAMTNRSFEDVIYFKLIHSHRKKD